MAFADDSYTAAGGADEDFDVTWGFLEKAHVKVKRNGVLLVDETDYEWTDATTITFGDTYAQNTSGDAIQIFRSTSRGTRLVDYTGTRTTENLLDTDSLQAFYMAQEAIDTLTASQSGLESIDTGTGFAPTFFLWKNSASPADADLLGKFLWQANTEAPGLAQINVGGEYMVHDDVTVGTEDAHFSWETILAGTVADRLHLGAGLWTSGTTGGDKGVKTANFDTLYLGGAELFATGHTWAGAQAFDGAVTVGANSSVATGFKWNVVDADGLQIGGTDIFARNNTWAGTADFDGDVDVLTGNTLNAADAAGLTIGGTDIFARNNTWAGSALFENGTQTPVELRYTAVGGATGPILTLRREDPGSVGIGDNIGAIWFRRDGGNVLAHIDAEVQSLSPGIGSGVIKIIATDSSGGGGAMEHVFGDGLLMEGASGGAPADGIVNAQGYEFDGTLIPYQEEFVSTGQTIAAAGTLTLAHGLSAEPSNVVGILECTTGEFNYSIGDRLMVQLGVANDGTTGVKTVIAEIDSTNVTVRFSSTANQQFVIHDKTTRAQQFLTNASWKLYVRAVA